MRPASIATWTVSACLGSDPRYHRPARPSQLRKDLAISDYLSSAPSPRLAQQGGKRIEPFRLLSTQL